MNVHKIMVRGAIIPFLLIAAEGFAIDASKKPPLEVMRLVNQRWINVIDDQRVLDKRTKLRKELASWTGAVYQLGNMAMYRLTRNETYIDIAERWANEAWGLNWKCEAQTGDKEKARHPDNQAIASVYIDLYTVQQEPERINNCLSKINDRVDAEIDNSVWPLRNNPPDADKIQEWYFIDWIFMAGPVLSKFGAICRDFPELTKDGLDEEESRYWCNNPKKYWDKMFKLYVDVKNGTVKKEGTFEMFEAGKGLWHQRPNSSKHRDEFWGRGNGWVIAAIPRMLEHLPEEYKVCLDSEADECDGDDVFRDPNPLDPKNDTVNAQLIAMLKTMAAALEDLQLDNGFWGADLKGERGPSYAETSATAFITYGLAWGINNGYLDRSTYLPIVWKAWDAMVDDAVQKDGKLGFVQYVGNLSTDREPGVPKNPSPPFGDKDTADCDILADTLPNEDCNRDEPNKSIRMYGIGAFLLAGSEVAKLGGMPTSGLPIIGVKASDEQDGNVATNTIDDNLETRWSCKGENCSIRYDLGSVQTVKGVEVAWFRGDQRQAFFSLESSEDASCLADPKGADWLSITEITESSGDSLVLERFDFVTPVQARCIRYVGYGNNANRWNSITEFRIVGLATSRIHVTASDWQDPNVPENTLDKDFNTRWSCLSDNDSDYDNCRIWYDLGNEKSINGVEIAWYRGDQRQAFFNIESSKDVNCFYANDAIWDIALENANSSGDTLALERFDFGNPVQARCIRYLGQGNSANLWNSITEVRFLSVFESNAILEAEDANVIDPCEVNDNFPGFTGSGFVDYIGECAVEWSTSVTVAGEYELTFRYALKSGNRPLRISVNGTDVNGPLSFPATGSWDNWEEATIPTGLNAGNNTIRASSTGSSGPNLDHLGIVAE